MLALQRPSYWADWWEAHQAYALAVVAALVVGSLIGALALQAVDGATRLMLLLLVKRFLTVEALRLPSMTSIFALALTQNLQVLGLLYVLGVSVAGLPLVLLALMFRGFVLGFAVGFVLGTLHGTGVAVAVVAVLLPNLALLPAWLCTGAGGLRFSWRLLARRQAGGDRLLGEWYQLTLMAVAALGLVCFGSLLQAFLAPMLLHWLAPWGL